MATTRTPRARAKSDRHAALLSEAARLFAERGFTGASLEELGAAVGVSGPAVYRHFANKQALLSEILIGVSERLLEGGRRVVDETGAAGGGRAADTSLRQLVRFHVDFAVTEADVIRVQDRDLGSLSDAERHRVRRLQRAYAEVWVGALTAVLPGLSETEARVRVMACFGLINSTPHSVRGGRDAPGDRTVRSTLERMAMAALTA